MRALGLITLLVACCVDRAFSKSRLYTGWQQKFDNEPYPDLTAQVGDTITFIWTIDDIQNVFIHPTNNCTQTGRIAVGNVSPTEYTFKPEDGAPGGKTIFFANDIGDRCENYGMRLVVTVFPDSDGGEIPDVNLPIVSISPTDAPVFTQAPVFPAPPPVAPTDAPILITSAPTGAPVFPTDAPVFPTGFPTVAPIAPTQAPISPTGAPTMQPSPIPTPEPSAGPTNAPTLSPTMPPVMGTGFPTRNPTIAPTGAPVVAPTFFPTPQPTFAPTETNPTENSNIDLQRKAMRGLQMTLRGIDSLSENAIEGWAQETAAFCTSRYANDYVGGAFRTNVAVTNVLEPSNNRRSMRGSERNLQADDVIVTYNQVVSYSNVGVEIVDINEEYFAKAPFDSLEDRSNYVEVLQNSNDSILKAVTDVSPVTFADEIVPTSAPVNVQPQPAPNPAKDTDEKFSLPLTAIIGIACGAGALLIIAVLFCIYCRAKKSDNSGRDSDPPPVNVAIKADEVSTLAGPSIPGNSPMYGDRSIGTVDYDYSKAYEDRDHSISYAGGTLGSDTQDYSFPANAGATGAALGPYDDDGSYGDHFGKSKVKVKEEFLHIFAPPGKLGVVIDTPDDGAPVVHAVKETSVVVDKVKVGDKLVAVDDEDVRTLTAIKVSKLISRKSANPSRKLTLLRITPMG